MHRLFKVVQRIMRRPWWPVAVGAAFVAFAVLEVIARWGERGTRLSSALLLVLCATAPLAIIRIRLAVVAIAIPVATLLILLTYQRIPVAVFAAQAVVFYLAGLRRASRLAVLAVAPFAAFLFILPLDTASSVLAGVVVALTSAAAGLGAARRARIEVAERRASEQRLADTLIEQVARGERARIARELHDVVAHHISMISVQAETARLTTPGMPAEGAARLAAIGDTARAALTEMRRLLGVLREDAGIEPTRNPQPGLTQLTELIDEARASAGASTRLIVSGHVRPLAPGVELTAYRIVQEALTNARRHAPSAAVDVEVTYTDEGLLLRVRDNGPGPSPVATNANGHGLLGMRERMAIVGGHLHVGPAPATGFLVEAMLPSAQPADAAE